MVAFLGSCALPYLNQQWIHGSNVQTGTWSIFLYVVTTSQSLVWKLLVLLHWLLVFILPKSYLIDQTYVCSFIDAVVITAMMFENICLKSTAYQTFLHFCPSTTETWMDYLPQSNEAITLKWSTIIKLYGTLIQKAIRTLSTHVWLKWILYINLLKLTTQSNKYMCLLCTSIYRWIYYKHQSIRLDL